MWYFMTHTRGSYNLTTFKWLALTFKYKIIYETPNIFTDFTYILFLLICNILIYTSASEELCSTKDKKAYISILTEITLFLQLFDFFYNYTTQFQCHWLMSKYQWNNVNIWMKLLTLEQIYLQDFSVYYKNSINIGSTNFTDHGLKQL